jgi:hypothetical protein
MNSAVKVWVDLMAFHLIPVSIKEFFFKLKALYLQEAISGVADIISLYSEYLPHFWWIPYQRTTNFSYTQNVLSVCTTKYYMLFLYGSYGPSHLISPKERFL